MGEQNVCVLAIPHDGRVWHGIHLRNSRHGSKRSIEKRNGFRSCCVFLMGWRRGLATFRGVCALKQFGFESKSVVLRYGGRFPGARLQLNVLCLWRWHKTLDFPRVLFPQESRPSLRPTPFVEVNLIEIAPTLRKTWLVETHSLQHTF